MSFYWVSTGSFIKALFSKYVWAIPNQENKIFLTFDDGPIPEITEWVLEELKKYDAKATFFCIGNNIEKNPAIFNKILADGHAIGNHTFNHRNGWKSSLEDYIEEVRLCDLQIKAHTSTEGLLFRPPYGKLKPAQARELRKKGYDVKTVLRQAQIFWPAEDNHQDYYSKHTSTPYCHRLVSRFE